MQEFLWAFAGILIFVFSVIGALFYSLQKDTLDYDMEYLWNNYPVSEKDFYL